MGVSLTAEARVAGNIGMAQQLARFGPDRAAIAAIWANLFPADKDNAGSMRRLARFTLASGQKKM